MKLPVFFMGHGAAIFTTQVGHSTNIALSTIGRKEFENIANLKEVKCIVVISAHYEADEYFSVGTNDKPRTIHDHPAREIYEIVYKSPPGGKVFGKELISSLSKSGVIVLEDEKKDLDHGAWLPPLLLYPNPTKPVIPISILSNCDFSTHIKFGEALSSLREEGFLFIGSGGLTHNQSVFRESYFAGTFDHVMTPSWSKEFEENALDAHNCYNFSKILSEPVSLAKAHPTLDHFMPFLICSGLAGVGSKADFVTRTYQPGLSTSLIKFV